MLFINTRQDTTALLVDIVVNGRILIRPSFGGVCTKHAACATDAAAAAAAAEVVAVAVAVVVDKSKS